MSWNIHFKIVDGAVDPESIGLSTGESAPPDGDYTINGHVHHGNDAWPSIGVTTPMGGTNTYFYEKAYVFDRE